MGPGQRALLRQGGLRTFLEAAAIGYASQNAGNELRVVYKAESVEDLILVTEGEDQAGVKSVAVLADLRRSLEVRLNRPVKRRRIEIQQLYRVRVQPACRQY